MLFLPRWLRGRDYRRLEAEFRLSTGHRNGIFVALSPGSALRFYQELPFWDLGVVRQDGDCLSYFGERANFALRNAQCREVTVVRLGPGWTPSETVLVESGAEPFRIAAITDTRELLDEIERWREAPATPAESELPLPSFPALTSAAPRELVSVSRLLTSAVIVGVISSAATIIVAPVWTASPALIAIGAMLVESLPMIRYRDDTTCGHAEP